MKALSLIDHNHHDEEAQAPTAKFGDIDGGDYLEVEVDGTLVARGAAITWRDEYVGGDYFVPNGAQAPDQVDVTIGGVVTKKWSFDGANTTEKLGNTFEIPHDMAITQVNNGTERLEFHLHLAPSTNDSGQCRFVVDWCYIPFGGVPIAGAQMILVKSFNANLQYANLLEDANFTIPVGGVGVGGLIEFTISRTPTHQDDTYNSDIIFYKAAMHVPCDMLGSRSEYIK